MDETTGRVNEIREEIAQTRVEMSETIEAIQERLTPSHLVAQAGDTVRNVATEKVKQMANTAERAADRVMDHPIVETMRSNPVPAAMVGIGAAWLLIKARSDSSRSGRVYGSDRRRDVYGSGERDWRVGEPQTTGAAVGTTGYADYGTSGSAYGAYGSGMTGESARVPELGGDFERYSRGRGPSVSFDRVVRDNPLALGAAAALIGVAIGMTVPASDAENRLMGEARDNVVDKARELASDAAQKVQDVAGKAVETASQVGEAAGRAAENTRPSTSRSSGGTGSIG